MVGCGTRASRSLRHTLRRICCFAGILAIMLGSAVGASRAQEPSARPPAAESLLAEGSRAYRRGEIDLAVRHWQQASEQARWVGSDEARVDALLNLGKAYQSLGRYRHAALELETALSIAEQAGDQARSVALKNSLGAALTVMRRWDRAEAILIEALVLAEQQANDAARAGILNNLGNLYAAQGRYQTAQEFYGQGFDLAQRTGVTAEAAKLMANAGISAGAAQLYADAEAHNAKAIELLPGVEDRREKAYLLITAGQTDAKILHHLPAARDRLLLRAFDSYRSALDLARRTGDARAQSYALGYLGALYELEERTDEALRLTRQAAFLAQQIRGPELLYRWQWQTGRLLQARDELEAAARALRQAVSTFEPIRHEVAGGVGNRSLLMDFREAAGGMYYDLADAQLRLADRAADPEVAQECMLQARQAIELFKTAEMVDYFRDRCIEQVRSDVREIEEISPDTAVVYLIPLPDRTELLLSLASGLKRFKVAVGSDELVAEVRRFRRLLEDRTSHRYRVSAQRIHRWLVEPIEETLVAEGVTTLVFVPDGALRTIPMGALHDGERFLIERFAVAVVPGLTLVAPRSFTPDWQAALMCGITEPVAGFAPLVHVQTELSEIEQLSGGRCLMNDAFRLPRVEKEVLARPPGVLHIASHGQFSADPSKTFVLTHDGRLTLDELEMLIRPSEFRGNPVELLALSACETAAGDDRAALGLAGVALKAGARSAMATLWFVNDEASARLVSGFYRNLHDKPGCTKAQALRESQCDIMKDRRFRHPCYWAPYLIIGNWL